MPETLPLPTGPAGLPPPGGMAVAVAFDWAIGAQIIFQTLSGTVGQPPPNRALALPMLAIAGVPLFIGERLRRGDQRFRRWQIGGSAVLGLSGWLSLPWTWHVLVTPGSPSRLSLVIILLMPGWIAWRLSLPRTRRWFQQVTPAQAISRHGGHWLAIVIASSGVSGVLVALSQRGP